MESIISVFRMEELPTTTRIKIIKELGIALNNQYAANITQRLVYELVLALDPGNEIKNDKSYTYYLES